MRVDVYSRHDVYIGTIAPNELLGFVHTDELNGEDSVAISTLYPLKEGYRLLWQDNDGVNHEHICQDPQGTHADGMVVYTDTALNSICETFGDYIEDKRPYSYSFARALEVALEPTRWSVGKVDQHGNVSSGLTFYHTSAREAINDILECGGELETVITVTNGVISKRAVNILSHRGASNRHKRFAYGKDISSCSKTEHYGAITACYGYGKGVETDTGGYGRKLTFGGINGGMNYIADAAALKIYGRPDGLGGYAHVFGTYENESCEDAAQLLQETRAYLATHKEPGVTYTADVVDLVQFGRTWEGVAVGDDVQMVDTEFEPELRCVGRVSAIKTDYLYNQRSVTLGNVIETLTDYYIRQAKVVSGLSKRSANWDVASSTPVAYLQQILNGLNEQFNTNGMSYCFTSFEKGTIWSSVPLDENGNPTRSGGSAMQINSQGFRIASNTKPDGSYDWRTFGTGNGFTADLITAGAIKGGNAQWNLETGTLENVYLLESTQTSQSGNTITYREHIAMAELSPDTPFGVYTAYRTRQHDTSTGQDRYSKPYSKTFVGGTMLNGQDVYMQAQRIGASSTNYMTTGYTSDSYPGFEFNTARNPKLFEIADLASHKAGLKADNKWFMVADAGDNQRTEITLPMSNVPDDATFPKIRIEDSNGIRLMLKNGTTLEMNNEFVRLISNNSSWIYMSKSSLQLALNGQVYDFKNGAFTKV